MNSISEVPMILRREIEARIIAPFLAAFSEEIGEVRTKEITQKVIAKLAMQEGEALAKAKGVKTLEDIADKIVPIFQKGDSLCVETKETDNGDVCWDVKRCAYTDMYNRIGAPELGSQLSCQRDEFLFKGINPDIRLIRTKTLMDGQDCCDFCLHLVKDGKEMKDR